MMGAEAVTRFGAKTIYKLMRKTGRLRARDLIPPAVMVPPADAAVIGAALGDLDEIVQTIRRQSFDGRAARWWDEHAGPFMRRLQTVMLEKLNAHVARRQAAIWYNGPTRLMVDGRAYDPYTGAPLN